MSSLPLSCLTKGWKTCIGINITFGRLRGYLSEKSILNLNTPSSYGPLCTKRTPFQPLVMLKLLPEFVLIEILSILGVRYMPDGKSISCDVLYQGELVLIFNLQFSSEILLTQNELLLIKTIEKVWYCRRGVSYRYIRSLRWLIMAC